MEAHRELEEAYRAAKADPEFMKEVKSDLQDMRFKREQQMDARTKAIDTLRKDERQNLREKERQLQAKMQLNQEIKIRNKSVANHQVKVKQERDKLKQEDI